MARTGRPPIPEDQRKKSIGIRLKQEDYDLIKAHGGPVKLIEEILIPVLKTHRRSEQTSSSGASCDA